ncbi:hypothetical protein M1M34_gp107 [Haloarcula tailed virus 2]|uniref:Uncharacterized protein n=1 Tax=Haloarcula tailed virus 2 TaxID=2877989 RepID=A0AAE8Y0M3_9CAUD|nr:hypothetical protein M1M34_gp107 [Haloarcula tailed virus 2]UBF23226.1 hypothetical protein HATV-2_gp75 [Haloarcula tailed virus 2]
MSESLVAIGIISFCLLVYAVHLVLEMKNFHDVQKAIRKEQMLADKEEMRKLYTNQPRSKSEDK